MMMFDKFFDSMKDAFKGFDEKMDAAWKNFDKEFDEHFRATYDSETKTAPIQEQETVVQEVKPDGTKITTRTIIRTMRTVVTKTKTAEGKK